MKFLTDEKLLIVGAGGMIGSNMVQTAMMLGLTPNICLYDIFEPGVHGVAEEMYHCASLEQILLGLLIRRLLLQVPSTLYLLAVLQEKRV